MPETLIDILHFLLEYVGEKAGPGPIAGRAQNLMERLNADIAEHAEPAAEKPADESPTK